MEAAGKDPKGLIDCTRRFAGAALRRVLQYARGGRPDACGGGFKLPLKACRADYR